jgi:hypothetical protein
LVSLGAAQASATPAVASASPSPLFDIDDLGAFVSPKRCVPLFLLFMSEVTHELGVNHLVELVSTRQLLSNNLSSQMN